MPILSLAEVHIWTALLPSTASPDIARTLSDEERCRARRFYFPADRFRYAFSHAVLRDVLSRYLDCAPGDIRFAKNAFGKPFVDKTNRSETLEFNLSHAGELVLIGVCNGRRIGVDAEEIRPMDDVLSIAESQCTEQECACIFGHPPAERARAFFRCWTRKEAYVKALGTGLSTPLNSFETFVQREPGRSSVTLPRSPDNAEWELADLDVPNGYMASVAVEARIDRLLYFEWQ